MDKETVTIIICVAIVLLIILKIVKIMNKITKASNKVDEALSGIDVALTKRYDVLTKMIEVVKGYEKYEKEVLINITELRSGNKSQSELEKLDDELDDGLRKVSVLAESYPELKASENFLMLQKTLVDVEEHLQAARRCYNANVSSYNELILTFPNSIIASLKNAKEKEFFKAKSEEKENVNVENL